jgi:hypothetical protein
MSHLRPLGDGSKFRSFRNEPNHGLRPLVSLVSRHDVHTKETPYQVLQLISRPRR